MARPTAPAAVRDPGPAQLDAEVLRDVALQPVRAHHAFESCVEQLATAVRLGVYPKGSMLPPERELAGRMEVSRATLREAIAALRQAGLLETVRGRGGGTVVLAQPEIVRDRPADLGDRREDLLDSLVFRRIVEPGACALAASRGLEPHQHEILRAALGDVARAEGRRAHRQADSRLHLAIATLTGSSHVVGAVTRVQADLHTLLTAIPVLAVNIDHSSAQHEAIVQAIIAGDADGARLSMEEHCDDTAALLRGLLG
ncbi:MAG TPA: FCD domain-containing protein [Segeticoccus sp.]|uniref:FadR/GntR family transcriptional regulator n=1 Tax=Segeticoccus sp. TaxID=2706531 RepID=UPI002D80A4D1|nr:FCD domain-containing protein [Segeticoccus sp.]HET8599767.1 FCD domain-containing protein [Segeticoccus sp.]